MRSDTLPSFWASYHSLDENARKLARKTYRIWVDNPFHPSLHFKCIDSADNVWAVRISRNCRALGVWEGQRFTWFWIGSHDEYERFYS